MALSLQQISQLDTARNTGQPQDIAALMALLMAGGGLGGGDNNNNLFAPSLLPGGGGGGTGTGTGGPGTRGTGTGQPQADPTQTLMNRLLDLIGGGDASTGGIPQSTMGPGPITPQDVLQDVLNPIAPTPATPNSPPSGRSVPGNPNAPPGSPQASPGFNAPPGLAADPDVATNNAITQNQNEANTANNVMRALSVLSNPGKTLGTLGGSKLGGLIGGPTGSQVGGTIGGQAGAMAGTFLGIPANPASLPMLVAQLANMALQHNTARTNSQIAQTMAQQTPMLEQNVINPTAFQFSGRGLDPQEGAPTGGGGGIGPAPTGDIGPAPTGPTGPGPAGVEGVTPETGFTLGDTGMMGVDIGGLTNQGQLNLSVSPVDVALPDMSDMGNISAVTEGSTGNAAGPVGGQAEDTGGGTGDGSGSGGPGSLLADFATGGKTPRQFFDFYDQFMQAHPKDGRKLFTAYQTVAKQVIAKAKNKKEEEVLAARVYEDFIDPVSRYMDDGDVDHATDVVVRTTKDLARKYSVPIPDRYDAVLKRQGRQE